MNWLKKQFQKIREIPANPKSVARGIAIGTLFGFVPILGLKTLCAIAISRLSRGNIIAAAIAVTLHDLLLPIAPALLLWEFKLGCLLLSVPHTEQTIPLGKQSLHSIFHTATLLRIEPALIAGGAILGIPFAIASYFITIKALKPVTPSPAKIDP
ncbi:DUF2062 domain-containing protein [Luteolibacter sp. AS25]|uniref:DUF2062 domain-containing protein n=1 Tax=Luteolibacter sp. AS25 TaxID=3135776 RepID=UPI00398B0001